MECMVLQQSRSKMSWQNVFAHDVLSFVDGLMASAGQTKFDCANVIFVALEIKINGAS